MTSISFYVTGEPKGQPRPRAFARKFGDKWQARVFDAGTAEAWKSQVAMAAEPHKPAQPLEGPIRMDLTFCFPRPKGHFRTGKHAGILKDSAPHWHIAKPDTDNCWKAISDALTQLGFWRDDSQVCCGTIIKSYPLPGISPGCQVRIARIVGTL